MSPKKIILVTGAGGFTGRQLCLKLIERDDWHVVQSTRSGGGANEACDLLNPEAVSALISKVQPEAIYHCAGSFSNSWAIDLDNNVRSATNLLSALDVTGIRARILLVGSAAEYGPDKTGPVSESSSLEPSSVYGVTKCMQTSAMQYYVRRRGLDIVLARTFNLHGAGISEALFPGTILKQIDEVKRGLKSGVEVKSLKSSRDYLPVGKAVEDYIRIMEFGTSGEIYNVGSGKPTPLTDLLEELLAGSGLSMSNVRVTGNDRCEDEARVSYACIKKLSALPAL